ncbi:hypothetical protein NIES2100_08070 [Calothrix sp. NIES-2100]|nr:hypothetical protein NIES2100_08070 [Calothrix sp. NIES-2100]
MGGVSPPLQVLTYEKIIRNLAIAHCTLHYHYLPNTVPKERAIFCGCIASTAAVGS